ncbi:DMT family transporter [Pseudooceanicola onchidii]|uniref:DMT family transporter n=1 Tax=Pseudooceanicola onchidii TaxID=2562279 RepID=UPI0010AA04FB|nr:DMT family transporter [Pseudooceanicola onchidii]
MTSLHGIALVIFSMAAFAIEDLLIKLMTVDIPTGQTLLMLGLGGMGVFGAIAVAQGHRLWVPQMRSAAFVIRTGAESFAALFFITSLSLVTLSTVAAVFQATPLAITFGAAVFLGETVGWRRWSAIGIGFLGVLIIIRPGLEGFRPEALFVLGAVVAIAARDLASRRLPDGLHSVTVAFYGFAALVVIAPVLMWIRGDHLVGMATPQILRLIGAVAFGTAGYYAIVLATRVGDVSAIMPFRYTRLVFSLILGMLVLGERPDLATYVGATIIIGSGLYTFVRERRLARRTA